MEKKAHWLNNLVNQSISDEAVYRTAPATPSLLLKDHAKFIDLNEEEKKLQYFRNLNFWFQSVFSLMHRSGPQLGAVAGLDPT